MGGTRKDDSGQTIGGWVGWEPLGPSLSQAAASSLPWSCSPQRRPSQRPLCPPGREDCPGVATGNLQPLPPWEDANLDSKVGLGRRPWGLSRRGPGCFPGPSVPAPASTPSPSRGLPGRQSVRPPPQRTDHQARGRGGRGGMGDGLEGRLPKGSSSKAASGRPEVPSRALGAEHVLFIPAEDAGGQKKYLDVRADLYFWKSYVSFSEEKRARPIS